MPIVDRPVLKGYLERGDKPTQAQFATMIDSMVNIVEDRYLLGLREYDPQKQYLQGDTMVYNDALYLCIAATTGVFNPVNWQIIAAFGAVVYAGVWSAASNFPTLVDGVGAKGTYYVVSVAGTQDLGSGPIDFQVSDWVIYNGSVWQKVDNSQAPVNASDVEFTPNGDITSTNVQDAIVEVRNTTDIKLAGKQDLISLTPNYFPYADSANTLADGALINEPDGVVLDNGKVFRSLLPGKAQIDFPQANTVIISTDGGTGAESILVLDTDAASLKRSSYGELNISSGPDANGEIRLINNGSNGLSITTELVELKNTQATGGLVSITDDGKIIADGELFRANTSEIQFDALTPSSVPFIDGSKKMLSSSVTPTELGYLSGTSSAIQTQLNGKLNLSGGTMGGNLVLNADPTSALQAATKQYVDGADASLQLQINNKLSLSGGTMTGDLVLNANPSAALGAATKQYVDGADASLQSQINNKLSLSGGTMTGNLVLNTDPTTALQAATKQYVDGVDTSLQSQINNKLSLSGGTMTGNLLLNANPSAALGAAPKQYVDSADALLQSQINDKLSLAGGTMTGNLILNANPSAALGAAPKQYVDSADALLQSQINDKLSLAGGTMTGNLILNANPSSALGAATKQYVDTGLATKQNSLGFTAVPDTRTVNGHALTSNVTVTKTDIGLSSVTDDQQLSQKVYGADEHIVPPPALPTSTSTAYSTAYTNTFSLAAGSYLVEWYYEIGSSLAAGDTGARISFGGTVISESICKPGVAGGFSAMSGFFERGGPLSAGSYTFLIEINRPTASGTVTLRRPRFKVTKI